MVKLYQVKITNIGSNGIQLLQTTFALMKIPLIIESGSRARRNSRVSNRERILRIYRRITVATPFLLLTFLVQCCLSTESEIIQRFKPSFSKLEDRFQKDSREKYKITGDIDWSESKLSLRPQSRIIHAERLDADFQLDVDFVLENLEVGAHSTSQIHLVFSNSWEILITIARAFHNGQILRQAIITEVNRDVSPGEKPNVNELRRSQAFFLGKKTEIWSLNYRFGLLKLGCNGHEVTTAHTKAFSSWLQAVAISQISAEIDLSRLYLSGNTVGYSPQQREHYNRANKIEQQAAQEEILGNLEKAIDLEKNLVTSAQHYFGKDDCVVALYRQRIGERYSLLGRHADALRQYEMAAQIFRKNFGRTHPETIENDFLIAEQHVVGGQIDRGASIVDQALQDYLRIAGKKNRNSHVLQQHYVNVKRHQATKCLRERDFLDSQKYRQEAVDIYTSVLGENHEGTKYEQCELEFLTRLVNSTGKEREKLLKYVDWLNKLDDLIKKGRELQICNHQKNALPLTRELFGDIHPYTAELLSDLAIDQANQGNFDLAITMQKEATEINRQFYGETSKKYLHSLASFGVNLSIAERNAEASALLKKVGKELKQHGHSFTQEYAFVQLELGRHLSRMNQYEEAKGPLTESFQLYRALGAHSQVSALRACERLLSLHHANGNLKQADYYLSYQRNIVEAVHGTESSAYCMILQSEANHLFIQKKFEKAAEIYEQAAKLATRLYGKNSRLYEGIIDGLIDLHLARGDMPAAVGFLEEQLEFELNRREKLFNIYSEGGQYIRTLQDRGSLDALLLLALEGHIAPDRAYNHALAFKGAVTAKQRSVRIASRAPGTKQLFEELISIDQQLADLGTQDTEGTNKLTAQRNKIHTELVKSSRAYQAAAKRTQITDLQRVLPDNVALIDYYEYFKPKNFFDRLFHGRAKIGLVAFVVSAKDGVHLIDLGSIDPINSNWLAWRAAMNIETGHKLDSEEMTLAQLVDRHGRQLAQSIWHPLTKQIGNEIDTIVVSPSVHLAACPFAALPGPSDNTFVIEQYALTTISTPRLLPELLIERSSTKTKKLLLVSAIDYNAKNNQAGEKNWLPTAEIPQFFSKFPNNSSKLKDIGRSFHSRYESGDILALKGSKATEASLLQKISGVEFVHLETHGFCIPLKDLNKIRGKVDSANTLKSTFLVSGVALASGNIGLLAEDSPALDGILWSQEIAGLDLQAVDLITLSACQTAIGNLVPGEGMTGSQRALHVAGCRSSLTTLWNVQIRSTTTFMTKFYSYLWEQRISKAKALQSAMIYMLREYNAGGEAAAGLPAHHRTPPALWAGFVLHGDWR